MALETKYISVILPLKLDWEPMYSLQNQSVQIGSRVRVPFSGRSYIGIVSEVGAVPSIDPSRIRPVTCVEEGLPPVLEREILLWRKIASYYLCSIGEVYKAAYPALKTNMEQAAAASAQKALERERRNLQKKEEKIRLSIGRLSERILSREESLSKARQDRTRQKYTLEISSLKEQISDLETELQNLYSQVHDTEQTNNTGGISEGLGTTGNPVLSQKQNEALTQIKEAFASLKPVLLHGVTGSGKTEIYISLAKECLAQGKDVLYLVPEIAISRQLESRLKSAFGDSLLLFHSAETQAKRRDVASRIRSSSVPYVLLGTRSALFLPHGNLGLVIIDEEHDTSYKQEDPAPRYNCREGAIILANIHGANIIMGSATPSLESLYNCYVGRHVLVELLEKYHKAQDADIEIIDTIAERRKNGMVGSFSRKLISRIQEALDSHGQVIILRARRAYSPALQCTLCGSVVKCPHCSVPMSLHKSVSNRMVCHYCGHTESYTGLCPSCQGELKPLGSGTQKIEEELSSLFPNARITRLDSDSAKAAGFEKKAVEEFSEGKTDILVGTQIVAKGFDFKGLSLAVALQADGILAQQDFRADEKAVQVLSQLRGRCSRRENKGLFIIQTAQADHPVYSSLTEQTLDRSIRLLTERKDFGFPPYSRIVEVVIKDSNQARLVKLSSALAGKLSSALPGMVTGPYAPSNEKLSDQWIMHIRVSLKKDRTLAPNKELIVKTVKEFEKNSSYGYHIHIDVDPV